MILGGTALKRAFLLGGWTAYRGDDRIDPTKLIGANSIDVTLGNRFIVFPPNQDIDTMKPKTLKYRKVTDEVKSLLSGAFILGHTQERFDCSEPFEKAYYAPQLEGRSTLARLGISVHLSAGFGDFGFKGCFTLELVNHSQNIVKLHAGQRIAQVFFLRVLEPTRYNGTYSGDEHNYGPIPPKIGPTKF